MRFEEIESVPNAKSMTSESAVNFLFKHNGDLMKIATIFYTAFGQHLMTLPKNKVNSFVCSTLQFALLRSLSFVWFPWKLLHKNEIVFTAFRSLLDLIVN